MADIENAHAEAQERARDTLVRIAEALQVPVQTFIDKTGRVDALSELAALSELMELWGRLHNDIERAQVLGFVRELVSRRAG